MPTFTLNVGVSQLDQAKRCVNPDQQALLRPLPLRKPRKQLKNNIKKYLTFDPKYDIIYSVLRYTLLTEITEEASSGSRNSTVLRQLL